MKTIDYAQISSDNVKLLLSRNGISVKKMAEIISVAPTTLNDSLKSKKGISIDNLIKIADYFKITVTDLCNDKFSESLESEILSPEVFLNKYKALDSHGKKVVTAILNIEFERTCL